MPDYWQPEDLAGVRPDIDEVAFGSPGMVNRWRGELRNAVAQLALTEAQLKTAANHPDAYGEAHVATLESRAASWRILAADFRRYLADELGPGPEVQADPDASLF